MTERERGRTNRMGKGEQDERRNECKRIISTDDRGKSDEKNPGDSQ